MNCVLAPFSMKLIEEQSFLCVFWAGKHRTDPYVKLGRQLYICGTIYKVKLGNFTYAKLYVKFPLDEDGRRQTNRPEYRNS